MDSAIRPRGQSPTTHTAHVVLARLVLACPKQLRRRSTRFGSCSLAPTLNECAGPVVAATHSHTARACANAR
eukprot:6251209-Alexandrium_andersonii.AAC.1